MDLSLFLTILGLAATFAFGLLSIDLFKRKKYPGKLTFVKQSNISLFNSIVKNFNEITILFDNKPIKENLIYIKGCFINDGDIDIEGNKIEKPISITLPDHYNWVNCKITKTSKDLICNFHLKEQTVLEFDFGLFRKNEFYQIEALIEKNKDNASDNNIFEDLKISHRISQTQTISKINLLTENQMKKRKKGIIARIWSTSWQILVPGLIATSILIFTKKADLHYQAFENGKTIEYKVTAKQNGNIELTDISTNKEKTILLVEFQDKSKYIAFIPTKTTWQRISESWYFLVMWFALIIVFGLIDYWELRKNNKIYSILKNEE